MKQTSKTMLALLLAAGLAAGGSTGTALAADAGPQMTITKTNLAADSAANYEGYGALSMSSGQTYEGDDGMMYPLQQSALIDSQGRFLFPYTVNQIPEISTQFVYSEGFVTVEDGYSADDLTTSPRYLLLDGSDAGIQLPDLTAQLEESFNVGVGPARYLLSPFYDGVAVVRESHYVGIGSNQDGPTGASGGGGYTVYNTYLIDTKGNLLCLLPERYNGIYSFIGDAQFTADFGAAGEGLLPVVIQTPVLEDPQLYWVLDEVSYLDYEGNIVLDLTDRGYNDLGTFSEGLAWVVSGELGLCGYIDKTGELVIPLEYDAVCPFHEGFAPVMKDGKWGAIDKDNNVVIPFQYDDCFGASEGYMTVGLNGKYGLVDKNNQAVVPIEYDDISAFQNGVAYAVKDGTVYIITPADGTSTAIAYASTQTITIDGKPVELQAYALKDANGNDTNYVKLRDIASLLNGTAARFEVSWDGSVNILTGQSYTANGSELSTPFSGNRPYTVPVSVTNVNGSPADLGAITLTDDNGGGYTYYQLRDLGRALGFNVGWSADQGIFLETDKPYTDAD